MAANQAVMQNVTRGGVKADSRGITRWSEIGYPHRSRVGVDPRPQTISVNLS